MRGPHTGNTSCRPALNEHTGTREFALRDPDGHHVVVSALAPD